ncbi:uncharacterized protein At5g39865 [Typha angustifolia]|uniref:uncharacterized protein At5g39865 n=1 Tax=Typha angustifolia TaxID=59011 RepID=UPI003C2D411B
MWPPWGRIPRGNDAAAAAPRLPRCPSSSLKDLGELVKDDADFTPSRSASASASPSPSTSPRPPLLHRVRSASSALKSWRSFSSSHPEEKRIVVYFTSLRVVRKTFEDCRAVRSLLRGLRVAVDERDLSMDSQFLAELKGILGRKQHLSLPQVFIGGRYIGGAEEVLHLHESGELKKFVDGAPPSAGVCDACGGVGFVLCGGCSGSHKCYSEKSAGFRSCAWCNENGLVRCTECYGSTRAV